MSVVIDKGWNDVMQVRVRHEWAFQQKLCHTLWVIDPPKGYGLWGIRGLWVIPPISTRERPIRMGYQGLWVMASMGYKEFDCIACGLAIACAMTCTSGIGELAPSESGLVRVAEDEE